jgi:hypothetical protein
LLISGQTLSGREAWKLKLVSLAYCERRSRIELRSFLDRLEPRPLKPDFPVGLSGFAAERRAFAAIIPRANKSSQAVSTLNPIPPFPETLGLLGDDVDAAQLASEAAIRGSTVMVCGNRALVFAGIDTARARGFITPLEAEQAGRRVRSSETLSEFRRAGLVFVAAGHNPFRLATAVLPRVVVCVIHPLDDGPSKLNRKDRCENRATSSWGDLAVFPYPRRVVQVSFCEGNRIAYYPSHTVESDATVSLAAWLKSIGREPVHIPDTRIPRQNQYHSERETARVAIPLDGSSSKTLTFAPGV